MTDAATISRVEKDRIGPGRLILVVGPSGAGKDTLIDLARLACAGDPGIVFAQRIVTRAPSAFEKNITVTPGEFEHMVTRGEFVLHWHAHGHMYGLPQSVVADIRSGRVVVANVSRTVVDTARAIFAAVTTILVTAPAEILAARIAGRARASDGISGDRLGRAVDDFSPDITINNVGPAEAGSAELLRAIKGFDESSNNVL